MDVALTNDLLTEPMRSAEAPGPEEANTQVKEELCNHLGVEFIVEHCEYCCSECTRSCDGRVQWPFIQSVPFLDDWLPESSICGITLASAL